MDKSHLFKYYLYTYLHESINNSIAPLHFKVSKIKEKIKIKNSVFLELNSNNGCKM